MKLITSCVSAALTSVLLATSSVHAEEAKKVSKPAVAEEKKVDKKVEKWDVNNPPGEEKAIKIKTSTTTWSSVDVSPDGKTIIF
ncbi:MAG: hypothetical protein OQK04_06480, partial [Kangiellaceae bacterium]|nr:hypothetical protein [Kangiellaceae bacterium]